MAGVEAKGAWKELRKLIQGMEALRGAAFIREVNSQLAEVGISYIQECFVLGRDPYGRKWKPLKYREGQILRDTGNLMDSIRKSHSAQGFEIYTPVVYAAVHNYGYKPRNIPKRQYVPSVGEGMPRRWASGFRLVAREARKRQLGR